LRKDELGEKLTGRRARVEALEVERAAKGGHALKIRFRLQGETAARTVDAMSGFRMKVGGRLIKSTLLTEIRDGGEAFEVSGRGWGHGAGMCQYGAWELARQGRTSFEILLYYYPGATIDRVH
jgi:SpoIID/LytB domain protein